MFARYVVRLRAFGRMRERSQVSFSSSSARLYVSIHSSTAELHEATLRTSRSTIAARRPLREATVNVLFVRVS